MMKTLRRVTETSVQMIIRGERSGPEYHVDQKIGREVANDFDIRRS